MLQTPYWRVVLDASDQCYLGRMYITARRHVEHEEELSFEEWLDLRHVKRRIAKMAKKGLKATHITSALLMNNAYRAQDPRPHVHYHVRPRYSKPQTVGGEVFVDLDFGEHHRRDTPREVSPETLQEIKRLLLAVENREG